MRGISITVAWIPHTNTTCAIIHDLTNLTLHEQKMVNPLTPVSTLFPHRNNIAISGTLKCENNGDLNIKFIFYRINTKI